MLNLNYVVPEAFGIVEFQLYRCAQVTQANLEFIETLNLESVVSLSPEPCIIKAKVFYFANEWRISWNPMAEEMVKEALETILKAPRPLLITCSGVNETGIVCGCLRKLQKWTLSAIVYEYRSFANLKARYQAEQFIELFDVDLVTLPTNLPEYLK